jgi:hypothetical protein
MAEVVFPDNTVLCNFAAVHRLDLLQGFLRGRGRWTEAVAGEARASARVLPDLAMVDSQGWLGEPVQIDEPDAVTGVEHLRRDVFGGTATQPLKHLGEAQTCFLLRGDKKWQGAWWVSDDRDALDFARFQGITTLETIDVVRHLVADRDVQVHQALDMMRAMAGSGRHLRLPQDPGPSGPQPVAPAPGCG